MPAYDISQATHQTLHSSWTHTLSAESRFHVTGPGSSEFLGFRVLGFRVLGFRVLGFRVLGFRVLGFRVLGFRV